VQPLWLHSYSEFYLYDLIMKIKYLQLKLIYKISIYAQSLQGFRDCAVFARQKNTALKDGIFIFFQKFKLFLLCYFNLFSFYKEAGNKNNQTDEED